MKQSLAFLISITLHCGVFAQTKYHDASQFQLIGKISPETETLYERLPAILKNNCRVPVWNLGKHTSGLAIRFRTNSTHISAKWEVLTNNHMEHMTDLGIKGVDLYAWEVDHWQYVNSGRPSGKVNEKIIISNMSPLEKEYMLYLPLYDGLISLSIGVDSLSIIEKPKLNFPNVKNPIVVYGTSITQGGCASRPGMSYNNILSRRLNNEVINLGFSGNGQLDYEIAEVMSKKHDASLFILDFIPNVNAQQIVEKTNRFVNIIRKENPKTPILFIETIIFPHSYYDQNTHEIIKEKNKLLKKEFYRLKSMDMENIYYLSGDNLIGNDFEATVDGIHLTDLGFIRFAEELHKKIRRITQKSNKPL
ncbi:MAG: SGNH/GDSL hydrolase family protein [Petrimonas sp.]|jgi:lysophospholipase L1-like esterase